MMRLYDSKNGEDRVVPVMSNVLPLLGALCDPEAMRRTMAAVAAPLKPNIPRRLTGQNHCKSGYTVMALIFKGLWCPEGDLHSRTALKTNKLLKTHDAQNAQNGQYAVSTHVSHTRDLRMFSLSSLNILFPRRITSDHRDDECDYGCDARYVEAPKCCAHPCLAVM
jgi:hypothetical protein